MLAPVAGEILLEALVSSISTFLCILNYDLVKQEQMSHRRNLCIWSTYGLVLHFVFTVQNMEPVNGWLLELYMKLTSLG